jgi:hypothetical protein
MKLTPYNWLAIVLLLLALVKRNVLIDLIPEMTELANEKKNGKTGKVLGYSKRR